MYKLSDFHIGGQALGHAYANEKVILIIHHHWWHLLKLAGGPTVLFALPFIVVPIIVASAGAQVGPIVVFLGALWSLFFWHQMFVRWTDFYFDIWIITNWRIIDLDLKGLFNIELGSMLDLDHIQEINTDVHGIIQNILNVGTLYIQTAATLQGQFKFLDVGNPASIDGVIRNAQVQLESTKAETRRELEHGL